jgi:hypothetical protein
LGILGNENKAKEDRKILAQCRAEMVMLSMKLKRYRDTLSSADQAEFNSK